MTHRTVESLMAQAAHMIDAAQHKNQTDNTLREFVKSASALRNVLYQDKPLDKAEFLFMDNHMRLLQMAYLRWKRKHVWPEDVH